MSAGRIVEAAGGVPFRIREGNPEILLIFRRGVWDLPKGKKEAGEDFEACALREVSEETGLTGLKRGPFLIDTFHEYEQDGVSYSKRTRWYAMSPERKPDEELKPVPQTEEGIEKVEWVPVPAAEKQVGFGNLVQVIGAFREKILQRKSS